MSAERRKLLLAVIENLTKCHREWSDNQEMELLSEPLWRAFEETIEIFAEGDLPGDLRVLAQRVEAMAEPWEEYKQTAEADYKAQPPAALWAARRKVEDAAKAAKPRQRKRLESLAEIRALSARQGATPVSDHQICLMYGWIDEDGQDETWKIREEEACPGKHVNDSLISPADKLAMAHEAREAEISKACERRLAQKLKAMGTKAPESLADLCERGVSRRQIASMKQCTVEDVERQCHELGIPVPPMDYEDLRASRGTYEKPVSASDDQRFSSSQAKAAPKPAAKKPATKPAAKAPEPPKRPRGRPRKDAEPTSHVAPLPPDVANEIIGYHVEGVELADIIDTMVGRADESEIHAVIEAHESSLAEA